MSELIEKIKESVVVIDGDCWKWVGAKQSKGSTPSMQWKKKVGNVRRFILIDKGIQMKGFFAWPSCGNFDCVNPDHVVKTTRKKATIEIFEKTNKADHLKRCLNTAKSIRRRGTKLTMEAARAIRSDDRPQRTIAAEYGVTQHTVFAIKRGDMWKEYAPNPFSALLR